MEFCSNWPGVDLDQTHQVMSVELLDSSPLIANIETTTH